MKLHFRLLHTAIIAFAIHVPVSGTDLSFAFAGDVMQGTNYPEGGNYLPSNDGVTLFDEVKDILQKADIAAANNEGTIGDPGTGTAKRCSDPSLCYTFRTPLSFVNNLVDAGFDFMSIANNHVNDFGPAGIASTEQALQKAGIAFAGLRNRCETAIIERSGKKIGFAAFGHSRGTLSILDMTEVKRVVSNLKKITDIVVVSFHGGGEGKRFSHLPYGPESCFGEDRGDLRKFAHTAIDSGADVIYGHGPHVTRAIELYNDRLIIYSLGNFCTPFRVNLSGISGYAPIITVTLADNGMFKEGQIHSFIQQKGIGPRRDTENRVARHIADLTKADFPATQINIDANGKITRK